MSRPRIIIVEHNEACSVSLFNSHEHLSLEVVKQGRDGTIDSIYKVHVSPDEKLHVIAQNNPEPEEVEVR